MTLLLRALSVLVLVAALWFVSGAGRPESYYPLEPGYSWRYEVSNGAGAALELTVTNLGRRQLGDRSTWAQRLQLGDSVAHRFATRQGDRMLMVGEQRPGQAEPVPLDPPSVVYEEPLTPGRSWESDSMTTVALPGTRLQTIATVEAVDEKVEVPGGTFERCVLVVSRGNANIDGTDHGPVALSVVTRLWYAAGVGVVRIERTESTDHPEVAGASLTYRLMSWTR